MFASQTYTTPFCYRRSLWKVNPKIQEKILTRIPKEVNLSQDISAGNWNQELRPSSAGALHTYIERKHKMLISQQLFYSS